MPNHLIILIALGLFGCGCVSKPVAPRLYDPTLVSPEILAFHGEEGLAVLLYPDAVHSYRVEKVNDRKKDYRVITQGPDLSPQQIDHLRRLYIDLRGYDMLRHQELRRYYPYDGVEVWGTGCEWNPNIVFDYVCQGKQVRVVICFGCSMWAFESDGKRYGSSGFSGSTRASGLQPMLRATTLELFPQMINVIPVDH